MQSFPHRSARSGCDGTRSKSELTKLGVGRTETGEAGRALDEEPT
jgi:hypothetical protein